MSDTTMSRLRAANPVPETPAIDDRELFARITASPPDARLRRGRRAYRRRFTTVAVALGALVLGSAGYGITKLLSTSSAPVKPPVTRHEYNAATHQLVLPPGYRWPKPNVPNDSVTGVGAGGGHAVLIAQTDWECYWVAAIRSGDVAGQRRAQARLHDLMEHNIFVAPPNASENWTPPNPPKAPYAVFADDGGVQFVKRAYTQAEHGHPKNLIESCRANR